MVIFIVLAVLAFMVMVLGIFFNRRMFKSEKIDGMYVYRGSESVCRKNGTRKKQWGFGIQKLKGRRVSFQIRYKIPDFYKKLRAGDRQALYAALILFGGTGFVLCVFLSIGVGLLESGEDGGWYVISAVVLFILLIVVSHCKAVKNAKYYDENISK